MSLDFPLAAQYCQQHGLGEIASQSVIRNEGVSDILKKCSSEKSIRGNFWIKMGNMGKTYDERANYVDFSETVRFLYVDVLNHIKRLFTNNDLFN